MKDIKIIALDLDGTLLDSQKRLSQRNRETLTECIRQGVEVVPCTGRIWSGVPDFIREFPGIHYAITVNGAIIEDLEQHCILTERKMSCEKAVEILELAKQLNAMYDVYVDGGGVGEKRFMEHLEDYGISPKLREMILATRQIVPDVIEEVRRKARPVEKINYFFGDAEERLRARKMLEARKDVLVSASFSNNLEINEPGAAKGEALLRLASHLGVEPRQTMGFGDGENDISLIRQAGIGVAMENGEEIVKKAADYVTVTNDEDGVAAALEYLLGIGRG